MKNAYLLIFAVLLATACTRQSTIEEPIDKWNGYSKYLKMGEETHIIWAGTGRHRINVGTATYGIDDNANFYVTYDCSASGWKISETHMFCGDKRNMPLNRDKSAKTSRFPYHSCNNPKVSSYTYRVPLTSLPPCEEPGFTVAAQCVVYHPYKCYGQTLAAWAQGDFKFNDKGCGGGGWFDTYFYNQPVNPFTVLYGTTYAQDSLRLYHLNMTTGDVTLILKEFVGNVAGTYDGAAFDVDSSLFFFVNYDTRELYVNRLDDTIPSFSAGTLNGTAASGTYYNGIYYYVNADFNTINMVTFDSDWLIDSETVLDTIPMTIVVNDLAMSPAGDYLYLLGEVNGGSTEMIKYSIAADIYYSIALNITTSGAQIAFGSDGQLYAIAPVVEGGSSSVAYTVNTNTGVLTEIDEGRIIIVPDAFTDISNGPPM
jgi:hypothetical protein